MRVVENLMGQLNTLFLSLSGDERYSVTTRRVTSGVVLQPSP